MLFIAFINITQQSEGNAEVHAEITPQMTADPKLKIKTLGSRGLTHLEQHMFSIYNALSSIPSKGKKKRRERKGERRKGSIRKGQAVGLPQL